MQTTLGEAITHNEIFHYQAGTGNLLDKGPDENNMETYAYDINHPHAANQLGEKTYAFDSNGNQVFRSIGEDVYELTYDSENKLVQVMADQPFMEESVTWEDPIGATPTPTYTATSEPTLTPTTQMTNTPTATPTATPTSTYTPTPTQTTSPYGVQLIGQSGPYTTSSTVVDIPNETSLLIVVEGGSNHAFPTSYTVGVDPLTLEVSRNVGTYKVRIYSMIIPPTGTDVDHAIPKSLGGNATLENAQLSCPHCNRSRQNNPFPKTPPVG